MLRLKRMSKGGCDYLSISFDKITADETAVLYEVLKNHDYEIGFLRGRFCIMLFADTESASKIAKELEDIAFEYNLT